MFTSKLKEDNLPFKSLFYSFEVSVSKAESLSSIHLEKHTF